MLGSVEYGIGRERERGEREGERGERRERGRDGREGREGADVTINYACTGAA